MCSEVKTFSLYRKAATTLSSLRSLAARPHVQCMERRTMSKQWKTKSAGKNRNSCVIAVTINLPGGGLPGVGCVWKVLEIS